MVGMGNDMNPIKHTKLLALSSFTSALLALSAQAVTTTWTGSVDADIGDASNWNNGLPNNSSDPVVDGIISNGATVLMESRQDLNGKDYTVSGGSTINLEEDFATKYSTNAGFRWGNSTMTLNGGHLDIDYTGTSDVGRGGDVVLNMNAGSTVHFVGSVGLGRDGTATVNQSGGSFFVGGTLSIQVNANPVVSGNVFNLTGGTVTANNFIVNDNNGDDSNYFNFTAGSTGTLTVAQSGFDFEGFIADGRIRLSDNLNSDFTAFAVTSGADWTRLALVPEPSAYALLAGLCVLSTLMVRRRGRVA